MPEISLTKKEEKELFLKALFGSPFFNIFASVLATFIVGTVFFKYGGGVPINVTSSLTEQVAAFEVSGEGEVMVIPDEARVRLGVRREGSSVSNLQEEVNAVMETLLTALDELGIEKKDVKTVSYAVNPDSSIDSSEPAGYVAYSEVEVRAREMEKASQVLDLAGQLQLEQVSGITFGLSEELEKTSLRDARKMAIEEAKLKAEELSRLSGMKLGNIINVKESMNTPQPYLMAREMAAVDAMGGDQVTPTPVEPGESTVRVMITLSYETK
jgi:hypothetical protein